ncbi:GntR family transcriptional regulator [Alkaliphilus transvaalensis]|uniref:GntR family transcriptional regulator n=1 Tax=Alkaliphilus transvaalensis TaxID=114628 RepID=UPI00047DA188|nr:GntR family transcriptional regulator [Alkaliphilus transvaalensis]
MFVHVDANSHVPIYHQIIQQIKSAAATGLLAPGDKLLSVRELSRQIGINPNTIARAYQELERDGIIETIRGVGTFLSSTPIRISNEDKKERVKKILKELFTEAYHLQYDEDELYRVFQEEFDKWKSHGGSEGKDVES